MALLYSDFSLLVTVLEMQLERPKNAGLEIMIEVPCPKITIGIGSLVWRKWIHRYDKTKPRWYGPYEVTKVLNPVSFELRLLGTNRITISHINKIKHYYPPDELDFPTESDPDDPALQNLLFSNQRSHADEPDDSAELGPSGLQEGPCNDREEYPVQI